MATAAGQCTNSGPCINQKVAPEMNAAARMFQVLVRAPNRTPLNMSSSMGGARSMEQITMAPPFRCSRCRHDAHDGPDQHLCTKVCHERGDDVPPSQTVAVWRGDIGCLHRLRGGCRGVSPEAAQHDGKAVSQGFVHA